jgi:nucleoside-diphosphate-sugar epimerase
MTASPSFTIRTDERKVQLQAQPMTVTVTVTGAAGKLGSHVCRTLVEAGYGVRATDKAGRRRMKLKLEVANLLDRDACYRLVTGAGAVVHLANYSDMVISDVQKLFNENVAMNMNVFHAALKSGVSRIIFASSIQVLGGHGLASGDTSDAVPYLPLDGDAPANPRNAYALSKQVGEILLEYVSRQSQISCVAIRYPWLIEQARHALPRKTRARASHLEGVFSYLSYTDAASLVLAILRNPLPGFRIYLPAHPKPRRTKSPADLIREYYPGVPLRRPLEEIESLVDISRIQNETGWSPVGSVGPR